MKNTRACIDKYIKDAHLNHIALRVGIKERIIEDLFASSEKKPSAKTLFDMASITKVMATTMLCLIAIEQKKIALEDSVGRFFDADAEKQGITIKHLLTHTMGIGHKSLLFDRCNYDNVQEYILKIPSDVPIGSETLYSCPGYILLGKILEKVSGNKLDAFFEEYIAKPLNLQHTSFHPNRNLEIINSNISPKEKGIVNDYNCRFLGGVAGNAGVFSCLDDVDKFIKMLLNFGAPLISREMFESAIKNQTKGMKDSRALGFVYVDEKYQQTGALFPKGSIGHCGHTGQSIFVDLKSGLYVIILSDATSSVQKKYGGGNYEIVMKMREDLHNAIKKDLELGGFE